MRICRKREFFWAVAGELYCGREAEAGVVVYGARQSYCVVQSPKRKTTSGSFRQGGVPGISAVSRKARQLSGISAACRDNACPVGACSSSMLPVYPECGW